MRRKTSVIDEKVHSQAVRAARNILAIIIEWSEKNHSRGREGLHMQYGTSPTSYDIVSRS